MTQSIRPLFDGLSRIAFLVGALLLSAVLAAPSSVAQDVPVVTEDEVDSELQVGDTFTKEIRVSNLDQANDVNAVDLTLDFGGAPVDFVGFNISGTLLDDFLTETNTEGTQASISGASNDPLGGGASSGVLVVAEFEVTGDGDGTVTFPDVRFNDVNPPDADLSQADFDVITTDSFVRIENATATIGNASTVRISATDLSGLGITNFDIDIEVEDPVELDTENPVDFLVDLDIEDAGYDPSTDVLSISGVVQDGEITGNGPLFDLNAEPVDSETTAALSFLDGTEFRDNNEDPAGVALSDGQLQVSENGAPAASDDSYSTGEESTLEVTDSANGVLANDTDPDSDSLFVSAVEGSSGDVGSQITLGSGATLTLNGDGTFTYGPSSEADTLEAGETTDDSFQYTAADGLGGDDQATATITLQGENDAPTISGLDDDDPTTIDENTSAGPIEFTVDDVEGDLSTLSVTGISGDTDLVQDADISVTGPDAQGAASLTVTPRPDSNGTTDITVEVSDGEASASDSFTLEVEAVLATISGSVDYPGEGDGALTEGRSLDNVSVEVSAVSGDMVTTTTTDSDGNFSVEIEPGEYAVAPQIDRDPADDGDIEINATDANRTIQAYLGINPFVDDFQEEVADVNDSGNANATDALKMALYFIDPDGTTFEAGDWATTSETVNVSDASDATVSLQAAAYGDADLSGAEQDGGSGAAVATASSASLNADLESDLRSVEMEGAFEVPVRLEGDATLGSYSLQVDFPADKVSFEGVAETDRNVMSRAEEGTIRLSWFDQSGDQPMKLGDGASLVNLRFSVDSGAEQGMVFAPEVTAGELAGPNAQPLSSPEVSVEGVEIGSALPDEFALTGSYPNPVSGGQAAVEMDLPNRATVTVEVYNTLGQRVQTMERSMAAGTGQTLQMDGSKLASGQYFYRVKADLGDSTAEETGRITVVR